LSYITPNRNKDPTITIFTQESTAKSKKKKERNKPKESKDTVIMIYSEQEAPLIKTTADTILFREHSNWGNSPFHD
jgi:hypothetical protein